MSKRILLIDDESSLRRSLSLSLNQLGYDVEPCESGIAALNKLELYQKNDVEVDSVVVDINLPDINGIKLGKIIHSKYPELVMMYITGYADTLDYTEMEDAKNEGLLEKPFSAEELITSINKIISKAPRQSKNKPSDPAIVKTTSAYALIKVKENADYFSLYKELYFMENVVYCDATRGDIDIFLLLQAESEEICRKIYEEKVLHNDCVQTSEFLSVGVPVLNDNIREIINAAGITLFEDVPGMSKVRDSRKSVYSYILVDVDREKLDSIYPVLRLTENILFCDFTSGSYNLVLMVFGTQFSEIDKIIENKIINLNGVLKVKEYPIINIYEM
jgi:CheY-like chemotaxis protein